MIHGKGIRIKDRRTLKLEKLKWKGLGGWGWKLEIRKKEPAIGARVDRHKEASERRASLGIENGNPPVW